MQQRHQHCVRGVVSLVALLLQLQVQGHRSGEQSALTVDQDSSAEAENNANVSANATSKWSVLPWMPCSGVRYGLEAESLKTLATWCNAAMVPEDKRVPKQLQGLFWLKDLPLPDVAACFSRGTWDQESLTITVPVWENFLYQNTRKGKALAWYLYSNGLTYKIKFNSTRLDYADISPTTGSFNPLHKGAIFLFDSLTSFPLIKLDEHRWHRPSYMGIGSMKALTNEYSAWRILDGMGNWIEETSSTMVQNLPAMGVNEITRYPAECWENPHCQHTVFPVQTAGLPELAAWCNSKNLPETATVAPEKVQGLYWLKGLPLQDVFACFTRGSWDEEKRSLTVRVFDNFLFRNTPEGMGLAKTVGDLGVTYHVNFAPDLKSADIRPSSTSGTAKGWIAMTLFDFFTKFPLVEQEGSQGTKWSRPSYFKVASMEMLVNEYEAWKILDGNGVVIQDTYQEMMKEFQWQAIHEVIGFHPETCTK